MRREQDDLIDFGETSPEVNALLQQGVLLYRQDRTAAQEKFSAALALDPTALPTYFCLYKIHTYRGLLEEALPVAQVGLAEAARQAGLSEDWRNWTRENVAEAAPEPARFALYTLKALAFIHLRRDERDACRSCLNQLEALGVSESIGGGVIASFAEAIDS